MEGNFIYKKLHCNVGIYVYKESDFSFSGLRMTSNPLGRQFAFIFDKRTNLRLFQSKAFKCWGKANNGISSCHLGLFIEKVDQKMFMFFLQLGCSTIGPINKLFVYVPFWTPFICFAQP